MLNIKLVCRRASFLFAFASIWFTAFPSSASTSISLAWDPNSEPDLAGYRLHYGPSSGSYTETLDVGNQVTAELTGLTVGETYFCTVTAYNTSDLESGYSNEVSFTVTATPIPPPTELDSDGDGLSDQFEADFGGGADLEPLSDLDGDQLSALAEFFHGLDPTEPLREPVAALETVEIDGETYFCIRYQVDPNAQNFVTMTVEHSNFEGLQTPTTWSVDQTVQVSSGPSPANPDLLEITERSVLPMAGQRLEVIRFRHEVITP